MGSEESQGAWIIDGRRFWCCNAIGCDGIASIVVQSGTDVSYAYCGLHWDELRPPYAEGYALYVPDRPDCFHTDCQTAAVSVMTHLDGTFLPVCEPHLDDLSWVSPTPSELLEMKLR